MSTTSITSLIVGQINTNEVTVVAQVNCDPENNTIEGSGIFTNVTSQVLIPHNQDNIMPLSGGSVIKIDTGNPTYDIINNLNKNSYASKVNLIKEKVLNKKLSSNKLKDIKFAGYKELSDIRLSINESFYEISNILLNNNFYNNDYIPEFILSSAFSVGDVEQFQNSCNEKKNENIRDENIVPFLNFQFIPFEIVVEIFKILSEKNEEGSGIGTFIGNVGISFATIYEKLIDIQNLSDEEKENLISAAILEIFPLYRIGEEVLIAEEDDKLQLGGFYTFFGSKFYIKTPDLSGRDSSESYSNFITLEENNEKKSLFYVLEILAKNQVGYEYSPVVLKYNQLPSLSASETNISYPEDGDEDQDDSIVYTGLDLIYTSSSKTGLNSFNELKYYLSPMIKSSVNRSIKKDKSLNLNYSQPIEVATIPLDDKIKAFSLNSEKESDVKNLLEKYGTIPLFSSESTEFGVLSTDTFLSAINRPEIIISDRINREENPEREVLFYSTQQNYTRPIVAGSLPRFLFNRNIDNNQIDFSKRFSAITSFENSVPKHWIDLASSFGENNSGEVILTLTDSGKSKLKQYFKVGNAPADTATEKYFDIGNTENEICFSVYVFDDKTGQFLRLPGPNITLSLGEAVITEIIPNGYAGGQPIKTSDKINLTIKGKNIGGTESAHIVFGTGDKQIGSKSNNNIIVINSTEIVITSDSTWSEITSNIGEFPIYLRVSGAKNKETNKDKKINISQNSVTVDNLVLTSEGKITFPSLNSVYYKSRGRRNKLAYNEINKDGPDSVPVLFSGKSVKIKVGSSSGFFNKKYKDKIFAYLAFKDQAIVKTFGLEEDVISIRVDGDTYYSNKNIVWDFEGSHFKSISSNSSELSFPGPVEQGPFNLRSIVEPKNSKNVGYFIFSNQKLTTNFAAEVTDGSSPISVLQVGDEDSGNPGFIDAPYILGILAKSDGSSTTVSNFDAKDIYKATKQSDSIAYKIKKLIPSRMIGKTDFENGKISANKTIDHLFLLFTAPKRSRKHYKDSYNFYIGSEKITGSLSGRIRYISDNIACAYFKKISFKGSGGFSTVSIRVNDLEYNAEYDSSLYTRVSKILKKGSYTIGENRLVQITDNNSRKIDTYNNLVQNDTSLIVPITSDERLYRYQKYGYLYSNNRTEKSGAVYKANNPLYMYVDFSSPIKVRPINLKITFGNIDCIDNPDGCNILGAFLSDNAVKDGKPEENIITASYSTTDIEKTRSNAIAEANSLLNEAKEKIRSIKNRNAEAGTSSETEIALESNAAITGLDSATVELNKLINSAESTVDEINAAIKAVNDLMKQASALADNLSSSNFSLSDAVDAIIDENIGPSGRSVLIRALNQLYSYIPSEFSYNESFTSESSSGDLLVVIKTLIEQPHVIEYSIPEIISIKINNTTYSADKFSELKLGKERVELEISLKGGDRDTKFELTGYRCSSIFINKESDVFTYKVIIEPKVFSLTFGGSNCAKITVTNSNIDRLKAERVLDPTAGQDIDVFFDKAKSGIDKQSKKILDKLVETKGKIKVGPVVYDKALAVKEALKSFCDMSFHLTAEISAQLKFLKILYIPIKVIFCIIDVICSLLHPVKLAFAVIRLFACLFDLILLLPQISMPILFLTIALHILELLLCVIHKILGIVVAINEIITALDVAVRRRDFESIKNLELALNEHLLTIEADLQVLEPILQILGLILELLQLLFSFPCQITQDEDQPACIDPSMLAGLIVSKVAPKGSIVPDAMLPLAQDYTNLSVDRTGENGNTPDSESNDPSEIKDVDLNSPPRAENGSVINNVLYKVSEAISSGKTTIVNDNSGFAGSILPDLVDSQTYENKTVLEGGFFSGDTDNNKFIDNINYEKLRFKNGEFNASFGISCTKSKKRFSFGTATLDRKNDPRFVEFQFKSAGLTNDAAFINGLGFLFKKKIIDDLFTLDSPPAMLKATGNSLEIHNGASINEENIKLISPIDGFSDFIEYAGPGSGFGSGDTYTYRAKPLVANIDVIQSNINPFTNEPETTTVTVTKTFGGIPSFAIVDEKFNVYFIEENGLSIRFDEIDGIKYPVIDNIFAKMINFPAAETQKFEREERQVLRRTASYYDKKNIFKSQFVKDLLEYCAKDGDPSLLVFNRGYKDDLGDAILKMQANAGYLQGLSTSILRKIKNINSNWVDTDTDTGLFGSSIPILLVGDPGADPAIPYTPYVNYRKLNDDWLLSGNPLGGGSDDYVGVNGAQKLTNYLVGEDPSLNGKISFPFPEYGIYEFANGSWAENDDFQYAINTIDVYNFPQIHFVDLRQVADDIAAACGASQTNELLLDLPGFTLDFGADVVQPYLGCVVDFRDFFVGDNGIVSNIREKLSSGKIPDIIPVDSVKAAYDNLVDCTNGAINDACKFVINPLNTTFKLIEDSDETNLEGYIDPSTVVTEVITDGAVSTMPTITGAMEYASGIGDSVTIKAGSSATIQIIPRDSYDDEIIDSLDAREKISLTIVSDTTLGAKIEKVDPEQELLWSKSGSIYTAKITSKTPGKVTLKASICNVVIQAVTDRGISTSITTEGDSSDCIPNPSDLSGATGAELFPPGALVKVDRILTVLFTGNNVSDSLDESRSENPIIKPQVEFTDMVN